MKPALVLLAAGASRRLGEPKALADIGGRNVLERLLAAGAACEGPALVIAGAHADELAAALPPGVELLHNKNWSAGRTGGVLLAARARADRDLCLAPADVPLVPRAVFDGLLAAWAAAHSPARGWLAPRFGDRHGHPVIVGRELIASWKDAAPQRPLRELRRAADPLLAWETSERAVLDDLDTPSDLRALRARASS